MEGRGRGSWKRKTASEAATRYGGGDGGAGIIAAATRLASWSGQPLYFPPFPAMIALRTCCAFKASCALKAG